MKTLLRPRRSIARMFLFIRARRGTPQALLEQTNISKTATDSKDHTDFFVLRSILRCYVTVVVIKAKTEVPSRSLESIAGVEFSYALLECVTAQNSTIAGVVGWATDQ
jgi:hypothetical protein